MVRNVEFSTEYQVDSSFLETLYGESIWTLDETSVESLYSADPTIEKIELTLFEIILNDVEENNS